MDCNKDDALKAKELAEKKLLERDLTGAKIFATKARDMYPVLDGLSQLLATIEVYVSAEKKVNGEVDWYAVLGVQPIADEQTIRRRYRKLALTLHPDKNKSVGADGAFTLISQAWSLLSDQGKRIVYDQRRNLSGIHQATPGGTPSVPAYQNGFFNNFNTAYWRKDTDQRSGTHPNHTTGYSVSMNKTFWTMCRSCRTKFEYDAHYVNCTLACVSCHQFFLAFEVSPPPVYRNASSASSSSQMKQNNINSTRMEANYHGSGGIPMSTVNSSLGSGPFFTPGGLSNVMSSNSTAAEPPGDSNTFKRSREESIPLGSASKSSRFGSNSFRRGDMPRKKRCTEECNLNNDRRYTQTEIASQNEGAGIASGLGAQKDSLDTGRFSSPGNCRRNGIRDVPPQQMKKMLIDKAQKDIRKMLDAWNASSKSRNLDKSKKTDTEVREKDKKKPINGVKPGAQEFVDSDSIGKKCFSADSEVTASISMSVPDPDFHDFDGDRVENAFGENQVWAVYDEDDGMPRYYALIHSVVSKRPFQMTISWLNSKTNDELAPIEWVSSGFPKTSGDFRISKRALYGSLNSFSHRVQWTKGLRGAVHIYPKKGEVWALYRNWSPDWNEFTDDKLIHQYDMVEMVDDYNEEKGVSVTPLIKVAGFKTVFHRNSDLRKIRIIPKAELFRLSHQVPSYLLTGKEGNNAPKGCLELDPAAMSVELLQVLTEAPEQEPATQNSKKFSEDGLVEGSKATKEGSGEDVPRKEVAEAMKRKGSKPDILYVYKRRRLGEKRALYSVAS